MQLRAAQRWIAPYGIYRERISNDHTALDNRKGIFMNTLRLSMLALGLSLLGGIAHADGKTREQVRAELMEAKAAGLVTYGEQQYPVDLPASQVKTSAQVREELDAARAAGLMTHGELDYPPAAQAPAGKTREQVIAEMREARARGLITSGELDYPPAAR